MHGTFLKNISYSLCANLFSFAISAILILVAPKFLGPQDYGMWQLFLFYISFSGCCHFGWIDGIYLRYAGAKFSDLNPCIFSGQLIGIILLEVIVGLFIYCGVDIFVTDNIQKYILKLGSIFPLLYNCNLLCNFLLQITNRIKEYSELVFIERIVFLFGTLLVIGLGMQHFIYFYDVKICSLVIACMAGLFMCRKLFVTSIPANYISEIIYEIKENVLVGIKLLIANTSSVLVIGIIRYGISIGWDVATFGRVSLTLSISNFLMIFINSVSIVLFPMLRTIAQKDLAPLYLQIRNLISILLFALLILYFPIRLVLGQWLPQYADYLKYMVILFPICVFESKVVLLINTYLKDLRQEKLMLKINLYAVLLSAFWTLLFMKIIHNLDFAVFGILLACAFRCFVLEYYVQKMLRINLSKEIIFDFILVTTFIVSGYLFENFISTFIYTAIFVGTIFINKKENLKTILFFKSKM